MKIGMPREGHARGKRRTVNMERPFDSKVRSEKELKVLQLDGLKWTVEHASMVPCIIGESSTRQG